MPDEQPPAGTNQPGETPPTAPNTPPAPPPAGAPAEDVASLPDWAQKLLKETRAEAASHRTAAKKHEDELTKMKQAAMTEEEKRTARLTELETQNAELQRERREIAVRAEIERQARKLGIVDEDAAFRLLDLSALEMDDAGNVKNAEAVLTKLLEAKPYLKAPAPNGSSSPALPGRTGTESAALREAELRAIVRGHSGQNPLFGSNPRPG